MPSTSSSPTRPRSAGSASRVGSPGWRSTTGSHSCPTAGTPRSLAADLHLASAVPGTAFVEYLTGSPYIDAIVADPWRLDGDGMLAVPDAPGLGVALDFDRVAHYARGERLAVAR